MYKHDLIDKLLIHLELVGLWNGTRDIIQSPSDERERIQVQVLQCSLKDWRTWLLTNNRSFATPVDPDEVEMLRQFIFHNFRLYDRNNAASLSLPDFILAEQMVMQIFRFIRTTNRLERV